MTFSIPSRLAGFQVGLFALACVTSSLSAAVTLTITDTRPGEAANTTPSSTLGSVATSVPGTVFPTTYTVAGLDLTSVGGTASEQIVFQTIYSQTGGTAVQVNGFGNISVTGGNDNQIDPGEALTATLSLQSTTFSGGLGAISIGFTEVAIGGVDSDETWNIVHDSGTIAGSGGSGINYVVPSSSFLTIQDVARPGTPAVNLQGFDVEISVVPEPSIALLGGLGLLAMWRRRR
jgi:hypothetical protein